MTSTENWLNRGREGYLIIFFCALNLVGLAKSSVDKSSAIIFVVIAVAVWPYAMFRRVRDIGLPVWWTIFFGLVTFIVLALPIRFLVAVVVTIAIHVPLLVMKSGRFSKRGNGSS